MNFLTFALWEVANSVIAKVHNKGFFHVVAATIAEVDELIKAGNLPPEIKTTDLANIVENMIAAHPAIKNPVPNEEPVTDNLDTTISKLQNALKKAQALKEESKHVENS